MHKALLFTILVYSVACTTKSEQIDSGIFMKGTELAEVVNPRLEELSGLAASVANSGLLWTHNDSGNSAEVFLINDKLEIKLTCKLKGANNRDWEDIAVGPG